MPAMKSMICSGYSQPAESGSMCRRMAVHRRVDAIGAPLAEQLDLVLGQIRGIEDAEADGVVDVVVDVGDTVDDADDLALERRRLLLAGMREDAVAYLGREVERFRDLQRMLVVAETTAEMLLQRLVERVLTGVAEWWMPHVMAKADGFDEVFVEPQRPRDAARDRRRLERVCHPSAVVVARRIDEHLSLPLQAAKRLGM